MKRRSTGIFNRIGALIFIVLTGLSVLFVIVTYMATTEYYQASTQLLNKDVAAHIAKFSSPYNNNNEINRKKADSIFYNAMIISPNVEVYFLDNTGKVIYYHSPDSLIKLRQIPLGNIRKYLQSPTSEIKSPDPKDPETPKIFSAAEVYNGSQKIGYIYVILVSKEYRNVAEVVFKSQLGSLAIKVFCIIMLTTLIFSLLYTSRLQKRFNQVITVLDKFKEGDLNQRFDANKKDEFYPISDAFNRMAVMLETTFNKQKELGKERKDFLASISHDLRTPLAVARGYTETMIIEKNENRQEHHEYLELVLSKIQQMEKMVLQLFELSKMEAVSFEPVKEPFIFSEILQEILNGAKFQAQQKNILINCLNCQDTALVFADISMLERVIQNLLENAIKYTDVNGEITVELSNEADQLVCCIDNTGIPLSDKLIDWINNGEEDVISRPANTGLGLALIKKIFKLHRFFFVAGVKNKNANYFIFKMTKYNGQK
jgi:signal transduction histidine kinase